MGMVPASGTVDGGNYVTTAGRTKFARGRSGHITFIASVSAPLPDANYYIRAHLERTSPDLFGTKISLRRAARFGGTVSTVLHCVGVQGAAGGTIQNNIRFTDSSAKRLTIDLNHYYYWVQVDSYLKTPATDQTVLATLGVSLVRVG